jgi:tetratricopeptide (TPR) repeat protein
MDRDKLSQAKARYQKHIEEQNYGEAIRALDDVLRLDPTNAGAHVARALAYHDLGKSEQAIADLKKARDLSPQDEDVYYKLGYIHLVDANYEEAIADFTKAIELNPEFVDAYGNRGNAYGSLGNYENAIDDFTKVISLEPADSFGYYNRANEYTRLGQDENAVTDYSRASELEPNDPAIYSNRGDAHSRLRQYQKAIDDYSTVITLNPKAADAYVNRASIYTEIGQYDAAIADFEKAFKLDPGVHAYYHRAVLHADLGEYDKAIDDYSRVISDDPADATSFYNRGVAYEKSENYEKAVEDYTEAIRLDTNLAANACIARANAYARLGKEDLAAVDRKAALDYTSTEPSNERKLKRRSSIQEELRHQMDLNEQLLARLATHAGSLDFQRTIDHAFVCPSSSAALLVERLQQIGLDVDPINDVDESKDSVWIDCREQGSPNQMLERTPQLVRIAAEFGAEYDGWGTTSD